MISSISWLNIWIWLEINLISFIIFIINNKNKISIESSLIYFLIQTISSIILLFSILIILFKNNIIILIIISIIIKLGSSPFHYWIPLIIERLNWIKIFILLTWQKINPLFILIINNYYLYLKLFIILSLLIGSIAGLNYISLKKIISFSSINQLRWIIIRLINNKIIKLYLFIYIYLIYLIIKSFNYFNLKFLNQLISLKIKNKFIKLFIFINLLSLGGLPPFLGFFPKLFIILKLNRSLLIFFIIIFSLLSLFMYLRIIFSLLILNSIKINKIYKNINYKKFFNIIKLIMINNFFLIILIIII